MRVAVQVHYFYDTAVAQPVVVDDSRGYFRPRRIGKAEPAYTLAPAAFVQPASAGAAGIARFTALRAVAQLSRVTTQAQAVANTAKIRVRAKLRSVKQRGSGKGALVPLSGTAVLALVVGQAGGTAQARKSSSLPVLMRVTAIGRINEQKQQDEELLELLELLDVA